MNPFFDELAAYSGLNINCPKCQKTIVFLNKDNARDPVCPHCGHTFELSDWQKEILKSISSYAKRE